MPTSETALAGRQTPMPVNNRHFLNKMPIKPPFPDGMRQASFGLGCFWGAEKQFWQVSGVYTTAVGYTGGFTENPTYEEVCSGMTGHNEAVLVVWDPKILSFGELLGLFWESHDPTQSMRQGNDVGTQYRSGIYCTAADQIEWARASRDDYQQQLKAKGFGEIKTEIQYLSVFYYAEDYHQQYLSKNPAGYCGLKGTGVRYKMKSGT